MGKNPVHPTGEKLLPTSTVETLVFACRYFAAVNFFALFQHTLPSVFMPKGSSKEELIQCAEEGRNFVSVFGHPPLWKSTDPSAIGWKALEPPGSYSELLEVAGSCLPPEFIMKGIINLQIQAPNLLHISDDLRGVENLETLELTGGQLPQIPPRSAELTPLLVYVFRIID